MKKLLLLALVSMLAVSFSYAGEVSETPAGASHCKEESSKSDDTGKVEKKDVKSDASSTVNEKDGDN